MRVWNRSLVLRLCLLVSIAIPFAAASRPPAQAPAASRIKLGSLGGALYRIDLPATPIRGLVLYCHGYGVKMPYNHLPLNRVMQVFLNHGFAIAQSQYRGAGWDVKEAVADSEALRHYFIHRYGRPPLVIVAGHSMGGLITIALIEQDPRHFQGALPLCGAIDSSYNLIQRRNFDPLVLFDLYFPGVIGSPAHLPAGYTNSPAEIARLTAAIAPHPRRAAILTRYLELRSSRELPAMIAFYGRLLAELEQRAGGNPFDNRNTLYDVGAETVAVNRDIRRYRANPAARQYIVAHYTPTGRLSRPVVAVHTLFDPLVPTWATNNYGTLVREQGDGHWFVQRWVAAYGHCKINARQTDSAFSALLRWVRTGQRPLPGEEP